MRRVALALAFAVAILGARFASFAASGADSYGYVSQADLWLAGRLIIDAPLADGAEWRNAVWTLTPLGYRPGDDRGTMVPTYSPGLPMVMAVFKAVGGADAVYSVVPLLGGMSVWLTFLLGARIGGAPTGLLAATALAVSPPFLVQLMWPMSDVPAMAWWLAAVVLALRGTGASLALAGAAAALATLTRPNLVVLAVPIVLYVSSRPGTARDRLHRAAVFAASMIPGPLVIAAFNQHLYGSPFASGYGTFSTIYASRHLWPNLANYSVWLLQTQTPFIALALGAPWLLPRRGTPDAGPIARLCLSMGAIVWLSYLWYMPFDDWTFLRFLLPAYPFLLALAAAAFSELASRAPQARRFAFIAVVVVLAGWGVWTGRAAFRVRTDESRYIAAGRFARELPESAVILCNQHSGSLRYYANRITMRFEWLDADMYTEAVEYVRGLGRPLYVVLDDWERDIFRRRYAGVADVSWLDEPPLLLAARRVYFYQVVPPPVRQDTGL